jgi:hypothetical protein
MATLKTLTVCGLNTQIVTSEDTEKESVFFLFPELTVSRKKRGQSEPEVSELKIGKRSFNQVLDLFPMLPMPEARASLSEGKLKELSPVLYKAIKESGNDPMEFYLQIGAQITEMEAEEESASASNPSTIICNFCAANYTADHAVPGTVQEYRDQIGQFLANMTDEDLQKSKDLLAKKETELGRYDSGQIRTRKQKGTAKAA